MRRRLAVLGLVFAATFTVVYFGVGTITPSPQPPTGLVIAPATTAPAGSGMRRHGALVTARSELVAAAFTFASLVTIVVGFSWFAWRTLRAGPYSRDRRSRQEAFAAAGLSGSTLTHAVAASHCVSDALGSAGCDISAF